LGCVVAASLRGVVIYKYKLFKEAVQTELDIAVSKVLMQTRLPNM